MLDHAKEIVEYHDKRNGRGDRVYGHNKVASTSWGSRSVATAKWQAIARADHGTLLGFQEHRAWTATSVSHR